MESCCRSAACALVSAAFLLQKGTARVIYSCRLDPDSGLTRNQVFTRIGCDSDSGVTRTLARFNKCRVSYRALISDLDVIESFLRSDSANR